MRLLRAALALLLLPALSGAPSAAASRPDLVIVISLDQVPYEYLVRFRPHFKGGLAMLLDRGAVFSAASYKHAQCTTGPGHAVIMSGTYGAMNGIVSNSWYDRAAGRNMYCVRDDSVTLVGAQGEGRSPRNYEVSSFGDMLRLHSGFRSRVIAISNKDRAAILMGGRMPDGVYWMVDSAFVTSTYYRAELPAWMKEFNRSGMINSFFGSTWKKSLQASAFTKLDQDDAPYEAERDGLGRAFPHRITGTDTTRITSSYYSALWTSPFGVMIPVEAARRAIVGERLGKRGVTDLLCLSISSTDYVGHAYGPHSHEIVEILAAVDRSLGSLFAFVDRTVGLQRCVIALTSDHGVSPIPRYLLKNFTHSLAGSLPSKRVRPAAEAVLVLTYVAHPSDSWVEAVVDRNIYLRLPALQSRGISPSQAAGIVADTLRSFKEVAFAWNLLQLPVNDWSGYTDRVRRSYKAGRSGEIFYMLKPYYAEGSGAGTGHGDPYDYNAHVPVVLMGPGIRPGTYRTDASPADLAPTLSALLGVEFPIGRTGRVLVEGLSGNL